MPSPIQCDLCGKDVTVEECFVCDAFECFNVCCPVCIIRYDDMGLCKPCNDKALDHVDEP